MEKKKSTAFIITLIVLILIFVAYVAWFFSVKNSLRTAPYSPPLQNPLPAEGGPVPSQ
jgi:flagellar basal body-associated protein FliL